MATRILLIEDCPAQALRLRLELLCVGVEVEVAATGQDGLAAARSQGHRAIVLDEDLPDVDGYSLCRCLKADTTTAAIPVVMLTRRAQLVDAPVGCDVGVADYIPKDWFAGDNLIATLRELGII